jgi:formate dehydrogenase beta subunit
MTALPEEIEAAEEDGVRIHYLVSRVEVIGEEMVTGVEALRQRLGEIDESGRRRPEPLPGTEFKIPCDVVVPAIGELATWVEDESLGLHQRGLFQVGKSAEINAPGVFAAGDAVTGPSTVVRAVAQGNAVAQSVDIWIQTGALGSAYVKPTRHDIAQLFDLNQYATARRPAPLKLTPEQRKARGERFDERESLWDEHTVQEECKRCLRCDLEWLERIGEPLP